MKWKNRSKSDRLDDIFDENIINGDMSEDELDELLDGAEADDESEETSNEELDDISDEEESDEELDDDLDEEESDEELDDIPDEEESDEELDDIPDKEESDEELDDILDEEESDEELDDILDEEESDEKLDDILDEEADEKLEDILKEEDSDEESEYDLDEDDKEPKYRPAYIRKRDSGEEKSNVGILLGIAWILFAVLCAVYVYVFFIKKPEEIPGKKNTVKLDIPDGANYRLCDIDEIDQLVTNFLTARANCNQQILQSLVTDPSQFDDMSGLEMIFTIYAKEYQNTTCYIVDGYAENEYIVIELSNLKLVDIKSQPLDIMSFYIIQTDDGSYKIDNAVHSTEVETYISNVTATQDIQDIYIHVKEQNDYLLQTDDAFADLYHRIMG